MKIILAGLAVVLLAPLPVAAGDAAARAADSPAAARAAAASATARADVPPGGLFDDDDTSIHQGWIEAIAAEGITRGCNPPRNDRFCPDTPVTRGQMAAFMVRAQGLPRTPGSTFDDTAGSVFAADIEALAAAGVTRGCNPPANKRFCPDQPVSRGQMAAFLTRAFDLGDAGTDRFSDDDGSIFEADIEAIAAAGITSGCGERAFCPGRPVTRAEMAAFLGRALGLRPIEVPPRAATVALIGRDAWGALPPGNGLVDHEIDRITIHHAGTAVGTTGPAQFRSWQMYHRSVGWPDLAYHFIIGRNGEVYEGRPFSKAGDTATAYDTAGHLLLVMEGDFGVSTPTAGQLEALARMVAWGSSRFGVPVDEITGHRDHAATVCPGTSLYARITDGSVAQRAAELIAAGGVTLVES